MRHLTDPKRVYFQTMEGLLFEMDIATFQPAAVRLVKEMKITRRRISKAAIRLSIAW